MQVSRINIVKDIVGGIVLVLIIMLIIFVVIPVIERSQLDRLKEAYIREQKTVIASTVETTSKNEVIHFKALISAGISPLTARQSILDQLENERYGTDGFGYYFALDKTGTVIMHPIMKELKGRNLNTILSPDGTDLGSVFAKNLESGKPGFVRYVWKVPGKNTVSLKSAYVRAVPELKMILGSGFYDSDFDRVIGEFAAVNRASIARMQITVALILAVIIALIAAASAAVYSRIRRTETVLTRQMLALRQYKLLLDETSLVSRTDRSGVITYVNDTFCRTTGYDRADAIGSKHSIERHPDTPLEVFRDMWETILSGNVWKGIIKNRKADGSSYFKNATIVPIRDENGTIVEFISSGQDITELLTNRASLENAFMTDQLTGLGSRLKLMADLAGSESPAVALLDIDGFSSLNQAFGQSEGDRVLRQLSGIILDFCRDKGGNAYRVYADTFAILHTADALCSRTLFSSELASILNGIKVEIGSSCTPIITRIGIAAKGADSFIYADIALRRAKTAGFQVHVFSEDETGISTDTRSNLAVLREIHRAIEQDGIVPYFQPIMDVETGMIVKYEYLVRITASDGRVLPPGEFIEMSKKANLYPKLTMRVIEKSIRTFRHLPFDFSVNLTIEDLMSSDTVTYLITEARSADIANRLIIEVVETEELVDLDRALESLERIRAEGMRIAIDDFGSGYSNFDYLLKLNPSFIKIDQSIIQNLMSDLRAQKLVASIVGFSRTTGIKTIAEYIDSEALLENVRSLGIDYVQGWLIGKAEAEIPLTRPGIRT